MVLLEELTPGVLVKGLLPGGTVTLISVKRHGEVGVELVYQDASGHLGSELLRLVRASSFLASILKKEDCAMASPNNSSESKTTYVLDAEDGLEMARLVHQDHLFSQYTEGLFAEGADLSEIHNILDLACGPGGWVLQVAHAYPQIKVVGVDISIRMLQYARAQALVQELNNTYFRLMDVTKPLDFPDSSFDLINARLISGFMLPAVWPKLLQECRRILRPGGIIRLSEAEYGLSNGSAWEQLGGLFTRALWLAGQSFSPDGRHISITPMLGRFLRETGYLHIQNRAHVIDFSAGAEAHDSVYQDCMVAFKLVKPFLVKMGVTTPEEVDKLYDQVMAEMLSDDFCALNFLLTTWGQRP